jgi:hypothetical protein
VGISDRYRDGEEKKQRWICLGTVTLVGMSDIRQVVIEIVQLEVREISPSNREWLTVAQVSVGPVSMFRRESEWQI